MESDEVIYDILECRTPMQKKKKSYTSRLDANYTDKDINVIKKAWATMGPAEYFPPNPSNYLRKNRNVNLKQIQLMKPVEKRCLTGIKMPPLPGKGPKIMHKNNINYIKDNIMSLKKMKSKECQQRLVITRYGDTINGKKLEPTHIYKKNFGTVPNYIFRNVDIIEHEAQKIKDKEDILTIPSCRYVTRPEREQLLNGLKHNWEECNKRFLLLPVITDSIPRINKRIEVEDELKNIEKDIVLVEKCPYIYILD